MKLWPHKFILSRHGQSVYNKFGMIGGDSDLTPEGDAYARKLAQYVSESVVHDKEGGEVPARLWTSTMKRTCQTAQYIDHGVKEFGEYWGKDDDMNEGRRHDWIQMRHKRWANLDEIYAGICDGMTYKEIKKELPEEWARKKYTFFN